MTKFEVSAPAKSGKSAQREARLMNLREVVEKYQILAGQFGRPVPLAGFGLAPQETERVFSVFDEDYHISRFLHFSLSPSSAGRPDQTYQINGFPQSHVSLDAEIQSIL
jgi:hypothetical protein